MSDLGTLQPLASKEPKLSPQKTMLGFWIYIMTDCILFASLFASFVVLRHNTWAASSSREIFSLPFVLVETVILLTSSFTMGLALLAARNHHKKEAIAWLLVTFILGAVFLGLEIHEFSSLAHEGNSWRASAFLSSYFTLVGTHGLHIMAGLIWIVVMLWRLSTKGISHLNLKQISLLALFWHFLDVVWIFIFSIVYLMGAI